MYGSLVLFSSFLILFFGAKQGDGCNCFPVHPQQQFCDADFVIRGRIVGKKDSFSPLNNQLDSGDNYIDYNVTVERIFKGHRYMKIQTNIDITAAKEERSCAVNDLNVRDTYLFAGKGKKVFQIKSCDWVVRYKKLSRKQRQGVRHMYKQYCNSCNISPCYDQTSCNQADSNTCMWDLSSMKYGDIDCESIYSRCLRTTEGTCKWLKSKEVRNCLAGRKRARLSRMINP
ncbi:metalloproteinase inhibitor 2-like [Anneissia japonica]|uniref:metalloproteinase inhibitor 2-like n=1 Tax=Anneissia japonica TaxID=1529436 RepID=UPI0014255AC5|nr:metalloproteinase inhibitor 2-like [Anneissia japonica]